MNPSEDHWNRWIDGEPPRDEEDILAHALMDKDPVFAGEKRLAAKIHEDVRTSLPGSVEPPYPDFFNSQIRKRIEDATYAEERAAIGRSRSRGLSWSRWVLTAAVAGAVAAFLILQKDLWAPGSGSTEIVRTYSPISQVRIETEFAAAADAVVLRLEGIDALPDSFSFEMQTAGVEAPDAGSIAQPVFIPAVNGLATEPDESGRSAVALLDAY